MLQTKGGRIDWLTDGQTIRLLYASLRGHKNKISAWMTRQVITEFKKLLFLKWQSLIYRVPSSGDTCIGEPIGVRPKYPAEVLIQLMLKKNGTETIENLVVTFLHHNTGSCIYFQETVGLFQFSWKLGFKILNGET